MVSIFKYLPNIHYLVETPSWSFGTDTVIGPPKMDGSWWRVLTKCGSLEKGMAKPLQYSCLKNPTNSMTWQKGGTHQTLNLPAI